MRQLTQEQLEAELQVGTVDLDQVEIVQAPLLREAWVNQRSLLETALNERSQASQQEADLEAAFQANLTAQRAAALATVIPDRRGADAVAVADQELPPYESQSGSDERSIADEGNLPHLAGGDMDQSLSTPVELRGEGVAPE